MSSRLNDYHEWLASEPGFVREMLARFPIWNRYRIGDGGFDGRVIGIDEMDGYIGLRVTVESPFFPRQVFGVKPEDLTLTETGNEAKFFHEDDEESK